MPDIQNPPELTNKAVFRIAVPMAFGYLTTPLVGMADTAIVGQLGNAALIGGVAVAAVFIGVLLTTFNFLRFATSALIAQSFGRGDWREVNAILLRSSLIAAISGFLVVLLARPIFDLGLAVMQPSAAVAMAAGDYFLIRALGAPLTLLNYVFFSYLIGTDRPVLSFLLQSFLNLANIVLSFYLVLGIGMGIKGAAWGAVIAEGITVLFSLVFILPALRRERGHLFALTFDLSKLAKMMILNSDIMVRSFCLFAAFAFFTRQSAQQNDVILAGNEILMHFFMIGGYFLDGFATAAEQFVARALGAGHRALFRRAIVLTSIWNLAQASILSVFLFLFGGALIEAMTASEAVRQVARDFLFWSALSPIIGVAAFQMDGVFIGATWSKDMRNSMIVSLALMVISYFILFPIMGNHGLWLAFSIFIGLRGASLYLILRKREAQYFAD